MQSKIVEFTLSEKAGIRAVYARSISGRFARHSHESYIIGVVLRGQRVIISNQQQIIINKGGVFQLLPYQEHSCLFAGENGCDYFVLAVANARFKDISSSLQSGITERDISLLLMDLFSALEYESRDKCDIEGIIKIIDFLIMQVSPAVQVGECFSELLSRGLDYINENYALKLSLEDIAEYACMSKYNFQRLFTKSYGMSPAALVDKTRVREVIARIKAGDSPSQVALDCGFSDQSHMCRVVKKVMGVSMRNYSNIEI